MNENTATKDTSKDVVKITKATKPSKPKEKKVDEVDLFVAGVYTLTDGVEIEYPKLSWGRQIKLLRIFSSLLIKVPELKDVNFEAFQLQDLVQVLPSVFEHAPESFSKMCALILDKDEVWVDDNLAMDDVLGLIIPFLKGLFSRIGKQFGGVKVQQPQS